MRPPVWSLSKHTAGLCIRFETDASDIQVRWELTSGELAMPHMPATGVSGVDLYVRTGVAWQWLANGRPTAQSSLATLVNDLSPERREFLLYLPLYNGVKSLELGIPQGASLWRRHFGSDRKPIVFWGTSITQGGCAARPGMVYTAILGRRLNRPVINLGFSGNGKMEAEVAPVTNLLRSMLHIRDRLPAELNRRRSAGGWNRWYAFFEQPTRTRPFCWSKTAAIRIRTWCRHTVSATKLIAMHCDKVGNRCKPQV